MVGSQFGSEGKTYCLFGMVCAAISTDVWDWSVVEQSSGLDEPRIPVRSRRGVSTHWKAVDEAPTHSMLIAIALV